MSHSVEEKNNTGIHCDETVAKRADAFDDTLAFKEPNVGAACRVVA